MKPCMCTAWRNMKKPLHFSTSYRETYVKVIRKCINVLFNVHVQTLIFMHSSSCLYIHILDGISVLMPISTWQALPDKWKSCNGTVPHVVWVTSNGQTIFTPCTTPYSNMHREKRCCAIATVESWPCWDYICNLSGMRSTAKPTTGFELETFGKMLQYLGMYSVGIRLLGRLCLLSVAICFLYLCFIAHKSWLLQKNK